MAQKDFTGPVNIGNDKEFTVKQLAEAVMEKIGGAGIEIKPLPSDDPTRRRPDISLARKALGWEPKVPLSEGLDITIREFKTRLEKQPAKV